MDFLVAHFSQIMFYLFAGLTVASAIGVVAFKSAVHSALALLSTFLMVAILFLLQHAEFVAAVQVMVYAGGIMVLFLFVMMLVNVQSLRPETVFLSHLAPIAVLAGVLLGVMLMIAILLGTMAPSGADAAAALRTVGDATPGNTEALGTLLFTRFLVPFEIVSVVLLVAMIGAIIFGRKEPALELPTDRSES